MAGRDELQTLKRGLQALAILNNEGPANVACIARRLEVPRANAHRIVNTLAAEGYCRKIPNSHLYIANLHSKHNLTNTCLSGLITEVSIDIVEDLGRTIKWPVALATPQGALMRTRLATHLSTPLALAKITPGQTASVLDASTGIVYLALASEQVREEVLADVAEMFPDTLATWAPHFPRVFAEVRDEGYFIMRRTGSEASLAIPVMMDNQPVAGLAMRYIKSATCRNTVVTDYLPQLRAAARAIEAALVAASQHRRAPEPPTIAAVQDLKWSRVNPLMEAQAIGGGASLGH